MGTLQLDADGARLYRRTVSEIVNPGTPPVLPGTVTYTTRRLCGFYPSTMLLAAPSEIIDGFRTYYGLNYELLSQDGPAWAREAYFNGAGVPVLGNVAYVCADFEVPETAPPGVGSNPVIDALATPGWDAGAVSARAFFRNGRVRFKAKYNAKMLVGLQEGADPTDPRARFFGVSFLPHLPIAGPAHGGLYRGGFGDEGNVETGLMPSTQFNPYSEATVWEVELLRNVITIKRGTTTDFTQDFSTSPLWQRPGVWALGAAIWEPEAYVDGIEVTQYDGADIALRPLAMRAGQGTFKPGANLATPAMTATGRNKTSAGMALPRMLARGGDGSMSEAALVMPAMTVSNTQTAATTVPFGRLRTPGMRVVAGGKTGTVARAALETPSMKLRGTKGNRGDALLTLPAAQAYGFDEPVGTARFFSHGGATSLLAPYIELAAVMNSAGQIVTVMSVGVLKDAAVSSGAAAASSMTLSAVLEAVMESQALVGADVPLFERPGEVWAVNLANNASTTFEDYPFNSFGMIGGRPFGAKADGLFLLDGDDDDGAPITASVSYGMQDFGTKTLKHMSRAYVGASSTGKLYLRIVANGKTYTYAARDFSPHISQQRFDVGRGIQANYFTFELVNNGSDFEIDSVSFFAAEFKRRI